MQRGEIRFIDAVDRRASIEQERHGRFGRRGARSAFDIRVEGAATQARRHHQRRRPIVAGQREVGARIEKRLHDVHSREPARHRRPIRRIIRSEGAHRPILVGCKRGEPQGRRATKLAGAARERFEGPFRGPADIAHRHRRRDHRLVDAGALGKQAFHERQPALGVPSAPSDAAWAEQIERAAQSDAAAPRALPVGDKLGRVARCGM